MGKYRVLGSFLDRVFRNNLNDNFNDVDADIQAQKKRVDDLIIANPSPSEVQDARLGFPVLRDKLIDVDAQLAETMKNLGIHGLNRSKFYEKLYTLNKTNGKVVWEGDSITENDDYDEKIATLFPNITHVHLGIGGSTTLDVINRLDTIKANNADLYVIAIGINDARYNDARGATTKSAYIANMTTIIDSLKLVGDVAIIGIWPHFHTDQYSKLGIVETDKRIDDWNLALDYLCTQKGVIFINPAPEIRKVVTLDAVPTLISDGVHPTTSECKQLYADAVLFGNVNRQKYVTEPKRATGRYLYKLEIYGGNDASGNVYLKDLIPTPSAVSGEWYVVTAATAYSNVTELFNPNSLDTFEGVTNLANDYPLIVIWNSTSPLTNLSYNYKAVETAITKFKLYTSDRQEDLVNPYSTSWQLVKEDYNHAATRKRLYSKSGISYVRASKASAQALTTTFAKILFDTQLTSDGLEFNTTNGEFTAPEAGLYRIDVTVPFDSIAADTRVVLSLYRNNAEAYWIFDDVGRKLARASSVIYLEQFDEVQVYGYATVSTSITVGNTTKMNLFISKQ